MVIIYAEIIKKKMRKSKFTIDFGSVKYMMTFILFLLTEHRRYDPNLWKRKEKKKKKTIYKTIKNQIYQFDTIKTVITLTLFGNAKRVNYH